MMKKTNGKINLLKKAGRFLTITALVALTAGMAGCGGSDTKKADNGVKVGIVQLVEHDALDAANRGFVKGLADNGYVEGKNITFDKQNAQADQSNLQNIAQRFVNGNTDLVCAIATPAAQTMANATSDIPIVATAVTDFKSARLVKDAAKPGTNITGTTDMNPIDKQVELIQKIVPGIKKLGVIYCSSEINSQLQVDMLKKDAAAKGISVKEATVSTVNDIQQAARSLIGEVQAIYIPTDNVMASALPNLCKITNEAKLPVIGGECNQVKSGVLIAQGVDYEKLGEQTGVMAAKILKGEAKPKDMPIESQKEFKIMYNAKTLAALGIKLPDDIVKNAKVVK